MRWVFACQAFWRYDNLFKGCINLIVMDVMDVIDQRNGAEVK